MPLPPDTLAAFVLPCPFCGHPPTVYSRNGVVISCKRPDCLKPKTDYWSLGYEAAAIAQWNRRAK